MDNAAYFFSGVLAGVAGITLLALLDVKYKFITTIPTANDNEKPNMIIVIKENCNKNTDIIQGDSTEYTDNEPTDTTEDTDKTNENTNDDAAVVAA